MSKPPSPAYERRLQQVVVDRLRKGETPEVLIAELEARLDPAKARLMVDEARWRLEPPRRNGLAPAILLYVWICLAAFQQYGLFVAGLSLARDAPDFEPSGALIATIAGAKLSLLGAGLLERVWRRSLWLTALYGLLILYVRPVGPILENLIVPGIAGRQGIVFPLDLYTLMSCASVAALAALWRLHHRRRPILAGA